MVCTCSHCGIFKDHSIVNEPDVLGWILTAWSFTAQQMKDSCGQNSVFTVFNELTQMTQSCRVKKKKKKRTAVVVMMMMKGNANKFLKKKVDKNYSLSPSTK